MNADPLTVEHLTEDGMGRSGEIEIERVVGLKVSSDSRPCVDEGNLPLPDNGVQR
jgi:hypothetical protein